MFYSYSAAALALLSSITTVLAQNSTCPAGFQQVQRAQWQSCGLSGTPYLTALQCSSIKVPRDYTDRSGPTLDLRIIRYPAQVDPDYKPSIITNPGGPGASGFEDMIGGRGTAIQNITGTDFNVVSFDPRGTALTIPNKCTPYKGQSSGLSEVQEYTSIAQQCETEDPDTPLQNTPFTARDVKAISEAVNDDGYIRYYGYSYGTLLGATVAAMFPDRIERMVLDGNVHANNYYRTYDGERAQDVDGAVANFFNLCASADECVLSPGNETGKDLQATYDAYRDSLVADERGNLDSRFFDVLYASNSFPTWANRLLAAYNTTQAPSALASSKRRDLGYNPQEYINTPTVRAINAIRCGDYQLQGTASEATYAAIDAAYSYSKYGFYSLSGGNKGCTAWTVPAKERFNLQFAGIKPRHQILFIQTDFDPTTPRNGALFNQQAFGGALFSTNEAGHCSGQQEAVGLNAAIFRYFNTNEPAVDTRFKAADGTNPFDNPNAGTRAPDTDTEDAKYLPLNDNEDYSSINSAQTTATATAASSGAAASNATVTAAPTKRAVLGMFKRADAYPYGCTPDPYVSTASGTTTSTSTGFNSTATGNATATPSGLTLTATGSLTTSGSGSLTTGTYSGYSTLTGSKSSSDKYDSYGSKVSTTKKPGQTGGAYGDNLWGAWSTISTSTKPATSSSWSAWDPQSTGWDAWSSQAGYIPVTKTVCGDNKSCKTTIVAVPTKTIYVDYVQDVCSTGITTRVVTVTATCNNGCDSKPTGVPQGYTTTAVYCSACANPSTVTITVKINSDDGKSTEWANVADSYVKTTAADGAKSTAWANVPDAASATTSAKPSNWYNVPDAASGSAKPTDWANVPAAGSASGSASGVTTGTDGWATWANPTVSGPIAKYTGGAKANAVSFMGLGAAVIAGLLMI